MLTVWGAGRFSLLAAEELQDLPRLQFVSRMNSVPALQGNTSVLPLYSDPFMPPGRGNLYAAAGIAEEHRRLPDPLRRDQGGR